MHYHGLITYRCLATRFEQRLKHLQVLAERENKQQLACFLQETKMFVLKNLNITSKLRFSLQTQNFTDQNHNGIRIAEKKTYAIGL